VAFAHCVKVGVGRSMLRRRVSWYKIDK